MSPRVDPVHVHGLQRLRREYLERHPGGGDFKAFLERFDGLREAIQGKRDPVRFYGLTFGHGSAKAHKAQRALGTERALQAADARVPQDEAGRLALLQQSGLATGAGTLADALRELELPFMFAGREQWVRNLGGANGALPSYLQDVGMESPVNDQSAQNLLLGRAAAAVSKGRSLAADLQEWKSLVPDWAYAARDQLAAQGIPFSVELLASPEINLTDASKPLFTPGSVPTSLSGLGAGQGGEGAFLASLSASELMTQVWPSYYRYHHRPAGAPIPPGFEAGLSFGSPALRTDGTYARSPLMETEAYKRWAALGFPGDPTQNGVINGSYGATFNPLLGTGSPGQGLGGLGQSMTSGALLPEHLYPFTSDWTPNRDVVISSLGVVGAAVFLNDPSIYFSGPRAPYDPAGLDADTLARLRALAGASSPAPTA